MHGFEHKCIFFNGIYLTERENIPLFVTTTLNDWIEMDREEFDNGTERNNNFFEKNVEFL